MNDIINIKSENNHTHTLIDIYNKAENMDFDNILISDKEKELLNIIITNTCTSKAVTTVLITSLTHKIVDKSQDIRNHQANMSNGYSGRVIDTKYITPFLKSKGLPSMKESGWLTRSLEQNSPYDFDYPGKIRPITVKNSFLSIINNIEVEGADPELYLTYILSGLICEKNKQASMKVQHICNQNSFSVNQIINMLKSHFNFDYKKRGASKLPVIALYSMNEVLLKEYKCKNNFSLKKLSSHTASDIKSGSIGDIEIFDKENNFIYEAIEVKFNIDITSITLLDAYNKFKYSPVKKYIITSTCNVKCEHQEGINSLIDKIYEEHGCEVFVENLFDILKFNLINLSNRADFINSYINNLNIDNELHIDIKTKFQDILNEK